MNLKDSIQVALLLAIGTLLHLFAPGYGAGMKPDLLLGMLFIVLLLKRDIRSTILAGLLAGLLSAMTTTFPGGQIPNILDKVATSLIIFGFIKVFYGKTNQTVLLVLVASLGTLISSVIFLGSALFIVGLPAPFSILFTTVAVPATIINTFAVIILYPIVIFSKLAVK